ncbi:MerR family transcriptional regulator [Megamonas sp.]
MYTMKQACKLTNLPYETLKFYCNEGLIPNIKRDKNNYRVFDERNIRWINNMQCLKRCGMGIKEMKDYLKLCLEGQPTIPARMEMLAKHRKELLAKINELNENLAYLDYKNEFYQNVLDGKIPYKSDLIRTDS